MSALRRLTRTVETAATAIKAVTGDADAQITMAELQLSAAKDEALKARAVLGDARLDEQDTKKAVADYRAARERVAELEAALDQARRRKSERLAAERVDAEIARKGRLRAALAHLNAMAVGVSSLEGHPVVEGVAQAAQHLVAAIGRFDQAAQDVAAADNHFGTDIAQARMAMMHWIVDAIGFKKSPIDPAVLAAWAKRLPSPDEVR